MGNSTPCMQSFPHQACAACRVHVQNSVIFAAQACQPLYVKVLCHDTVMPSLYSPSQDPCIYSQYLSMQPPPSLKSLSNPANIAPSLQFPSTLYRDRKTFPAIERSLACNVQHAVQDLPTPADFCYPLIENIEYPGIEPHLPS